MAGLQENICVLPSIAGLDNAETSLYAETQKCPHVNLRLKE